MIENVLTQQEKLNILIDSESFDQFLSENNKLAGRLLGYSVTEVFAFLRSPYSTSHSELQRILELRKNYDENNNLNGLEIIRAKSHARIVFSYRMDDIERIAAQVYQKESLTEREKESILLVFIQAILHPRDAITADSDMLVTGNDTILKNRLWFESHFPGSPLNIVEVGEALQIMDLFVKSRGNYHITSNSTCNRGFWYNYSFRTKVHRFSPAWGSVVSGLPLKNGSEILGGFSDRFMHLLRAIDEIGFQHYLGTNNDTLETTAYHLNYFITLVTGIFDSLANLSVVYYDLKIKGVDFDKEKGMNKITLRGKTGKDFLGQLQAKNQDLSDFIISYECFIELFYLFRERILHRERLEQTGFGYQGEDAHWRANFIIIPSYAAEIIRQFDDEQEYEPFTKWGIYDKFLEPFHFVKAATEKLVDFCNGYLEWLNFNQMLQEYPDIKRKVEEIRNTEKYKNVLKEWELFENNRLGF